MRLLLIEDDAALRLTLARQLEADGYRVDQARDGEEGLFLAREYPVDLVIVDLGLPKLNGLTIVQRLRRDGSALPILILTARGSWPGPTTTWSSLSNTRSWRRGSRPCCGARSRPLPTC
jgi:two-component system, OmpR family, response regulator PhoP